MGVKKLKAKELLEFYRRTHSESLARNRENRLGPVINRVGNLWVNRFIDYAHRQGMKKSFGYFKTQWGTMEGRALLDLGSGRGRWIKEFATRGAQVTGVDISPDAIEVLRTEFPQHSFFCLDLTHLSNTVGSFDVVNSVTVLQHMPIDAQRVAFKAIWDVLKEGGFLVLLEKVTDFDEPHVSPHRVEEWARMAGSVGFKLCASWGSNFETLIRAAMRLAGPARAHSQPRETGGQAVASGRNPLKSKIIARMKTVVALASFPVEWVCQRVPLVKPTRWVMVFRK